MAPGAHFGEIDMQRDVSRLAADLSAVVRDIVRDEIERSREDVL